MTILLTGSNGMLGNAIKRVFTDCDLILTAKKELDIRRMEEVRSFSNLKIDLILHTAAETDLARAELNPADTYLTNYTGTQNMVDLAKMLDIPIMYISTAGVFGGCLGGYNEDDETCPAHCYGKSKQMGEDAVRSYEKHFIVRCGWSMGGGPDIDKKFINKVFQQIKAGKTKLYGVTDIHGNLTYTMDFAQTLKNILESGIEYGTYHAVGRGAANRFDILCAFVDYLKLKNKIELIPVTDDEFQVMFPMKYDSKNEVLHTHKIDSAGVSAMRDWRVSLRDYVKEFAE